MRQRCWLWLICLAACIFHGRIASGQSLQDATKSEAQFASVIEPQRYPPLLSLIPSDTLNKNRFWIATGLAGTLYTGTVIALNEAWYKQFPRSSFHTFNDTREWRQMDKMGHLYTSYFESFWSYKVARWTGMNENSAIWTGAALGLVFQGTVEVLDGFSEEWGFSVADMGFNLLGSGAFVAQQKLWGEQRILFKVSSTPMRYPSTLLTPVFGEGTSSLRSRTDDLFGQHYAERFLKDYNAQTVWLSVNIHAFLRPENRFPKWLNLAVGYGAENLYGGFANRWTENDSDFELSEQEFPRYSQFYLSPDIDFSRIPSKSPFVRTVLGVLNVFKMPGPVLEMSGEDDVSVKVRW